MKKLLALLIVAGLLATTTGCPPSPSTGPKAGSGMGSGRTGGDHDRTPPGDKDKNPPAGGDKDKNPPAGGDKDKDKNKKGGGKD